MREITSHKVNGVNESIQIKVLDEPGAGNACHAYELSLVGARGTACHIHFQNGPIKEAGVNGFSHEALLAIVIDRLEGFQSGPFANSFNAEALGHIQAAVRAMHRRTLERMARGVEGTHQL